MPTRWCSTTRRPFARAKDSQGNKRVTGRQRDGNRIRNEVGLNPVGSTAQQPDTGGVHGWRGLGWAQSRWRRRWSRGCSVRLRSRSTRWCSACRYGSRGGGWRVEGEGQWIPALAGMTIQALWEEAAAVQRNDTSNMVPGQLFAPVLDWHRELLQRSTAPSSLRTREPPCEVSPMAKSIKVIRYDKLDKSNKTARLSTCPDVSSIFPFSPVRLPRPECDRCQLCNLARRRAHSLATALIGDSLPGIVAQP